MFILIMLTKFVFQNYYFVYSSKFGTNIQIIIIYNNKKCFYKNLYFISLLSIFVALFTLFRDIQNFLN